MPIISTFFGMIIRMYHSDHNPPHFHVQYAEIEAVVEIKTGRIIHGKLPPRLKKALSEWRKEHLKELEKAWKDAQNMKMPKKIKPLE